MSRFAARISAERGVGMLATRPSPALSPFRPAGFDAGGRVVVLFSASEPAEYRNLHRDST